MYVTVNSKCNWEYANKFEEINKFDILNGLEAHLLLSEAYSWFYAQESLLWNLGDHM